MPFSSVLGASTVIKPGVCTSTTRPTTPYDGQVIYETDTDRTLVYNGTGWVFLSTSRANPGGLDLIKTQTIGSAVSTVEVTDAFSSTYDAYKIIVTGGVGSTAGANIGLRLGSTSTGYYWSGIYRRYSDTTVTADKAENGSSFNYAGRSTTTSINLSVELFGPNLAKNTQAIAVNSGAAVTDYFFTTGGYLADTTQYTAFTLIPNTGTLTGGTIAVYGYAK